MTKKSFILMADVVGSSNYDPAPLARNLRKVVDETNSDLRQDILSPLTITLGDEFQALCQSLQSAIKVILYLEQHSLRHSQQAFKLRYVLYEGLIETPINTETSYGMLGKGLTEARHMLTMKSGQRAAFQCILNNKKTEKLLVYVFDILLSFREIPTARKQPEILEMLLFDQLSDTSIAEQVNKTRSEIWKFRQNWQMHVYISALNILQEELY